MIKNSKGILIYLIQMNFILFQDIYNISKYLKITILIEMTNRTEHVVFDH